MFTIDNKWATILSDFCLDISKAYFIASFISQSITINGVNPFDLFVALTKGMFNVIFFLVFSRYLLKFKK